MPGRTWRLPQETAHILAAGAWNNRRRLAAILGPTALAASGLPVRCADELGG